MNKRKDSNPYVTRGRLKFRLCQILINAVALLAIAGKSNTLASCACITSHVLPSLLRGKSGVADKQTSRAYFYYTCCSSPLLMRLRVCRFSSRPGRWISGLFQCLPDGEILEQDLHPAAADSANGHRGGADPAYEQWHRKSSPGRLPAHHCQVLSAAQCALQFHRVPELHRKLWPDRGASGEWKSVFFNCVEKGRGLQLIPDYFSRAFKLVCVFVIWWKAGCERSQFDILPIVLNITSMVMPIITINSGYSKSGLNITALIFRKLQTFPAN